MGYPTIAKFDVNFIIRTQENLNNAQVPNSFTQLLNSLIGLVFLPHEFNKKKKRTYKIDFLNQMIGQYPQLQAIFNGSADLADETGNEFNQMKFFYRDTKGQIRTTMNTTIGDILRLFRNGIAHSNITPVADGNDWHGVIIKNFETFNKEQKDDFNFATYLTQRELRLFSNFIADQYLSNINK